MDEEDEFAQQLDDQMEIADQIKDDIIPLALEYYLGVIEIDGGSDDDDDEMKGIGGDDSDDDGGKKKKKKGGKGGAAGPD